MTAPVNTALPVISGSAEVGETLTTDNGSWNNSPASYAYAWLRSGAVVSGQTSSTYAVTTADIGKTIAARVTATNVDGSASATSDATDSVPSTLVVEDGSGMSNADAYVSLAYAATYHDKYGNDAWSAASAATQERAIRRATQYIDTHYRFRGSQYTYSQKLLWPRADMYVENIYQTWPVARVQDACCELALRALDGPLNTDQSDQAVTEETVGPITTKYAAPQQGGQVRYSVSDSLLAPFVVGGSGMRVMRLDVA